MELRAHPIILPAGTEGRWHYLNQIDDASAWDEFAGDLLDAAVDEPDTRIKDDILLLVLVACNRANQADPAVAFNLAFDLEAA